MGIRIGIGGLKIGGSSGSSWTPQNFLTTNSASDNVTALNDALTNHRSVKITTPGVYEINDTIYIPSNTKLEFVAGCTLESTAAHGQIFLNKGALTGVRDNNIKIIGAGLIIKTNGFEGNSKIAKLNGHIDLFQVDNFEVSGITCTDFATNLFFLEMRDVTYGSIHDLVIKGNKDGMDIIYGRDLTIYNIVTQTLDDALYIGGLGYTYFTNAGMAGDCERITVTNWDASFVTGQTTGGNLAFQSSSWENWTSGHSYQQGDACTNNGRVYRKTNAGSQVAANAPVHVSGIITGGDGTEWTFGFDSTITHISVKDVVLKDCTLDGTRVSIWASNGVTDRVIYPGTLGNGVIDLVLDNISYLNSIDGCLFYTKNSLGKITFKNMNYTIPAGKGFILAGGTATYPCKLDELIFDNCVIDASAAVAGLIEQASNNLVFSSNKLTIKNSNIKSTNTDAYRLVRLQDNQTWKTIEISDSILDSIHDTIECVANVGAITVNATNVYFKTPKYVTGTGVGGCILIFNGVGCQFDQPVGFLFFNNQVTSSLTFNTSGSSGAVTAAKVMSGGYVTRGNSDLPV